MDIKEALRILEDCVEDCYTVATYVQTSEALQTVKDVLGIDKCGTTTDTTKETN